MMDGKKNRQTKRLTIDKQNDITMDRKNVRKKERWIERMMTDRMIRIVDRKNNDR